MSQSIHQMQISFVPTQDRLLFRLNTSTHEEFRLWFTRRYTKQLWLALRQLLENNQPISHPDPQAQAALLSFQHEQVMAQADFATAYQDPQTLRTPLGQEPILVTKLRIKANQPGIQTLCLHPDTGQGLEITLDAKLMHSLSRLLSEGIKRADWDLPHQLVDNVAIPIHSQHLN